MWAKGSRSSEELNDSLHFAVCIFKGVVARFCLIQFPSVPEPPPPPHKTFMLGLETSLLRVMRLPQKMGTDSEQVLLGNRVEQSVLRPVTHTHTHSVSFSFSPGLCPVF